MSFKIGDKVSFLNETGEGVVREIISLNLILVENQDGFDQQYDIKDLVSSAKKSDYQLDSFRFEKEIADKINVQETEKSTANLMKKFKHLDQYGKQDLAVVDLHIQELYDSYQELTNFQIVSIQLNVFKRELNVAIRKKVKKIIFIHGKGKGVLKAEIAKELYEHYPELSYQDASFNEFGYGGATEINSV